MFIENTNLFGNLYFRGNENLTNTTTIVQKPCGNLTKPRKTLQNHMTTLQTLQNHGKYEGLRVLQHITRREAPRRKFRVCLLYITRRAAPRRNFRLFHCILCGAKRRGENFEEFYCICEAEAWLRQKRHG